MARRCIFACVAFLVINSAAHSQLLLFVSSSSTNSVLRYNGNTGAFIDNFASGGGLNSPAGLAINPIGGNLLVAGTGNNNVRQFNINTGTSMGNFTSGGSLMGPDGMIYGGDGKLYVSGGVAANVQRFNSDGTFDTVFGTPISSGGTLLGVTGVTFGGPTNQLFAGCFNSNFVSNVQRFPVGGGAGSVFTSGTSLPIPAGITFGPDGNLYVSSSLNNSVLRYNGTTGVFMNAFIAANAGGLSQPYGLGFGPDNNLYVASYGGNAATSMIKRYDGTTGAFIDNFASGGGLNNPTYFLFYNAVVPEPSTIVLSATALAFAAGLYARHRYRKKTPHRHRRLAHR